MSNVTVIVDYLSDLTDGRRVVVSCRKHSLYEGDNATEVIQATEVMDGRVRKHVMYHRIWDDILDKKPTNQHEVMKSST